MTLSEYIDITSSTTTRTFGIYLEEDEDDVEDRIICRNEKGFDKLDELCVCTIINNQMYKINTFIKPKLANAEVVRQFITADRIYVIVRMDEDEEIKRQSSWQSYKLTCRRSNSGLLAKD